jgi:hypothetical protein
MIKQIVAFVKALVRGDEGNFEFELTLAWWEVGAIVIILGLITYLIWR